MARQGRRARIRLGLEGLESRCLLNGDSGLGLLVGFQPGTRGGEVAVVVRRFQGRILGDFPEGPVWIEPGAGVNVPRVVNWLQSRDPAIRYIEPNGPLRTTALIPNDPGFPSQWGLNNPASDIDIDAPEAWSVTQGNPGTIVAIVDSGIDFSQPDFAGRIWVNPGEAGGRTGVDDDGDGLVDDLYGWNFRNGNNDLSDGAGHGTHVAGIVGARGNDGTGVVGVDWNARIMPLKFIGRDGNGSVADAVRAIYYAVDHGARVINASWGGSDYSRSLYDAINYAGGRGVVFVTAAGNEAVNNDRVPSYPALNRLSNLISVAAVDQNGRLASFSNYGPTTVDVAAPGVGIISTVPGGFDGYSGTSMATAFVTGVASLVVGLHPDWSAAQVVQRVVASAKPLPSLTNLVISGGIVDAAGAVGATTAAASVPNPVAAPSGYFATADSIRAEILASPEFYQVHGGTDGAFLNAVYQELLDRPTEPGAQDFWLGRMAGEGRLGVVREISGSIEAIQTKVARWLKSDLGWSPSIAELKGLPTVSDWANYLVQVGQGDSVVHQYILASPEFSQRSGGTDALWLGAVYRLVLGRDPDPEGRSHWLGELARTGDRASVALQILTSTESRVRQVATWFHDDLRRPTPLAVLQRDPDVIGFANRISD